MSLRSYIFAIALFTASPLAAEKPNILFIAVDDMRNDLNCYGNTLIHSPNIDSLATRGVIFDRAYVNIAVCNPSRASMMTGLRPDSIRVWDLRVHFREAMPDAVTLPQHLRKHGYHAVGMGKIYHNPTPDPQSWSEPVPRPAGVKNAYSKEVQAERQRVDDSLPHGHHHKGNLRGPAAMPTVNTDEATWDGANTTVAVDTLRRLGKTKQPFFLAMGYVRPHLPFTPPKKYWDLYTRDDIKLARNRFIPKDSPPMALGDSYEMRHYSDMIDFPKPGAPPVDDAIARRLLHGYYASISFVDAQIGRLLTALKEEALDKNTIVIFWSDHGWKLGEHNGWSKMSNYEVDTRIPFIVADPRAKANGQRCNQLVESVDIFPTVCDLTGIPRYEKLEGRSFKHLLDEPTEASKNEIFTQWMSRRDGVFYMGYAMRTNRHRYVEWRALPGGTVAAREVYDLQQDPDENQSLINSASPELLQSLEQRLQRQNPIRPLDRTPAVRSKKSTKRAKLTFTNNLAVGAAVYWITPIGARKRLTFIKPGKSWTSNTFIGHTFVVESHDGKLHRIVESSAPEATVTLK
jgi:iduronate 2-sulfatase